jgi:hypothetical protein
VLRARGQGPELLRLTPWAAGAALALVAIAATAPAAPARDVGELRRLARAPAGVDAVAYAGADRIFASGRRLLRVAPDGRIVRVARLRGQAIRLDASATTVALIEARGNVRRVLAGPPAGPLRTLARCRGRHREIPYSLLAVAGDVVAEALTCRRGPFVAAPRVRVHTSSGLGRIDAPAGEGFIALAGAPGVLATALRGDDGGPVRVEVVDPRLGALRYAVPGLPGAAVVEPLAVQEGGVAAFCGPRNRLAWASPPAPTAHALGEAACPEDVALAGESLAYQDERTGTLRVATLGGAVRTLVRGARGLAFDWSGDSLLVGALGCREDFLAERGATGPPYRPRPCHVRVRRVTRTPTHAKVTVTCRPACRGFLDLGLGRGRADLAAQVRIRRPGKHVLRVRLDQRARRLLRRYRRVPFTAALAYVNPPDGASSMPIAERSGWLRGDGRRRFPPPPPSRSD